MISRKHINRLLILPMSILSAFASGAFAADPSATAMSAATPQASRKLSPAQLDEANARVQVANSIANRVTQDAESKGLDPSWRMKLLAPLYNLTSEQLRNIEPNATTLDQAHTLANETQKSVRASKVVAKNLGDAATDLVFVPKTPCRFIDTRQSGGGGPIATTRDYNTENYGSANGGDSTCTLPGSGEIAFAANVTVVIGAGAPGYIGIRPYGSSNSTSFLNWPAAGAPSGLANAGIITTAQDSNASNDYVFEIFNGGTTSPQVILDYFGYFEQANFPATALSCLNPNFTNSTVSANSFLVIATPACPSGYTAVAPICNAGSGTTYLMGSGPNFCQYQNVGGSTSQTLAIGTQCCRMPAI